MIVYFDQDCRFHTSGTHWKRKMCDEC